MEDPEMAADYRSEEWQTESDYTLKKRDLIRKIETVLARNAVQYRLGRFLTGGGLPPSKKLGELVHGRDMPAIHREFDRAMESPDGIQSPVAANK